MPLLFTATGGVQPSGTKSAGQGFKNNAEPQTITKNTAPTILNAIVTSIAATIAVTIGGKITELRP